MLEVRGIQKKFRDRVVLDGVNLSLGSNEIGVLLGPSGTGKTTLLRIIAGLERADAGDVFIDGKQLSENTPPSKRPIAMLFQSLALFPHLRARENVSIAMNSLTSIERQTRAEEMLVLCGLKDEAEKYPHQLSGGQQQRLALARALAPRPRLLLMDEPFSSLDPELRARLSLEVRSLLKSQNVSSLIVTHQLDEAYDLADRIGILNHGRIDQWATPYELYHKPESHFVAQYLDRVSFMNVRVDQDGSLLLGRHRLGQHSFSAANAEHFRPGSEVQLLVRPDDIQHDDASPVKARVRSRFFRGSWFLYELELEGMRFFSYVPSHHTHAIGDEIGVRFEIEHLISIPG